MKILFNRPADNSIGVLRLMLASMVIVSHGVALGGFGKDLLWRFSRETCDLGDLAVDGFFILSGALVAQSFLRLQNSGRYLWQRCLRIFPGYWVCLAVTSLVIGGIAGRAQFGDFQILWTKTNGPYSYIVHGLFLAPHGALLNLFDHNPVAWTFNNSLWTLRWEFSCYLLVAACGLAGLFTSRKWILWTLLLIYWSLYNGFQFHLISDTMFGSSYFHNWRAARLPLIFFAGTLFFLYRDKIVLNGAVAIVSTLSLFISTSFGLYPLFAPLLLPIVLFYLAIELPFHGLEKKLGDYSYGLYIYAYPMQQTLVTLGFAHFGLAVYLAASFVSTLPFAVLSWHWIEKPALRLKDRQKSAAIWLKFKQYFQITKEAPALD